LVPQIGQSQTTRIVGLLCAWYLIFGFFSFDANLRKQHTQQCQALQKEMLGLLYKDRQSFPFGCWKETSPISFFNEKI
jgi:hypothetical protein